MPENNKAAKRKTWPKIVIGVLIVLAVLYVAAYFVIAHMYTASFIGHSPMDRGHYYYLYDHYAADYPRQEVAFPGTEGELHAFIYGSENDTALVVIGHGIGSFHEDYMSTIVWLVDHGYRVFAPDLSGSGYSGGEGTIGLPQSAIDLDSALTYIEQDDELNRLPKVLFGHSWGAYGVAAVLNYGHDVKACVTVAGYNSPTVQMGSTFDMLLGPAGKLTYPLLDLYHFIHFGKNGLLTAVEAINNSNVPVLIVQGQDDIINTVDGTSIYAAREKITNPIVQYHLITKEHCADHLSPFCTDEANEILWTLTDSLVELNNTYTGEELEQKTFELYESFDKDLMSQPNEELYQIVDEFYREAIR